MEEPLVKMSGKGQLVVPRRIRENEGFTSNDRFVAIEVKDGVLFKRVDIPKVKIEFESLSRDIQSHLRRRKVKQQDVTAAVKWAREK